MKVTRNWLRQYVDIDEPASTIAEQLSMLGLEVEGVEERPDPLAGVVVARILASEKHPNADRLSVCRVTDGQEERQIVCGASNFQTNDKVPLALPGTSLKPSPDEEPITIKKSKLRGVQSEGMLCSATELGTGEDSSGLMILPTDAPVGDPLSDYLGRPKEDVLFDLEITPNRPDLNSVIGIARELHAKSNRAFHVPDPELPTDKANGDGASRPIDRWVNVRLEAPDLCPRYTARVIRDVQVGQSPDWLRYALEQVGIRSINNIVDVTNYVMLEIGQPLHAFDYDALFTPEKSQATSPSIVVRQATSGEQFVTLDGEKRDLSPETLLIADETKGLALAGVMGGANSEINADTTNILLESAYFKPQNIRATAKRLGLQTDASYRFERGADIEICDWASRRAASLILQTAGGQLVDGLADAYPVPHEPKEITLRHNKVAGVLGLEIPATAQTDYLHRLGLEAIGQQEADTTRFRIPSFRVDLKREIDLIEEVARIHGVERIPTTTPRGVLGEHPFDSTYDELAEIRHLLTGLGINEAQGQTLISESNVRSGGIASPIRLEYPLSSDMNVLRPSLIPGLLDSLQHNLAHKNHDVALFEIGRVFPSSDNPSHEELRLAITLTGARYPTFWSGPERGVKMDIYDLKGIIEEMGDQFGVPSFRYIRSPENQTLYLESASLCLGDTQLGEIGQLRPQLAKAYDLRDPVLVAELNLDTLLAHRNRMAAFQPLPTYPDIRRDIALVLPEATLHETVVNAIRDAQPPHLERIELFDLYRGENVAEGYKSMAYELTYRHPSRTLTDNEVNATQEQLLQHLRSELGATIRDS